MASEPSPIDFDEFATHLSQVFEQVKADHRPIFVERDGDLYRLERQEPNNLWVDYDPEQVKRGIRQAAGVFVGVDTEQLLADIQAEREQGPGRTE